MFLIILVMIAGMEMSDHKRTEQFKQCAQTQVRLYDDLCAESSSGYQQMSGTKAHYEGVKCAAKTIEYCAD